MKVELEKIRLAKSALTDEVFAGTLKTNKIIVWKNKVNVTNDFIQAIIDRF